MGKSLRFKVLHTRTPTTSGPYGCEEEKIVLVAGKYKISLGWRLHYVSKWNEETQSYENIEGVPSQGRTDMVEALNLANLLSTAPEMLEVLRTILEFVDSGGLGEGVNAHAKATLEKYAANAIAKATGGVE